MFYDERKAAQHLGFSWLRHEFNWNQVEPSKGAFRWEETDKAVETFKSRNINILGLLCYTADWARQPDAKNTHASKPADVRDFGNYVFEIVSRYKGTIKYWEIWNEPDLSWGGTVEEYVALLKEASTAAKKADPDCVIVAPALCNLGGFLDGVFKAGGGKYFDILADHPYATGANLEERLARLNAIQGNYGEHKKVWITETGFNSRTTRKVGETESDYQKRFQAALAEQAEIVVKNHVLALANGVEKVFWYQIGRDGDPESAENWGLLMGDVEGTPSPSARAYQTLIEQLNGARFAQVYPFGRRAKGYLFSEKNGATILAIWGDRAEEITLDTGVDEVEVIGLDGASQKLKTNEGRLNLSVGKSPIWVKGLKTNRLSLLAQVNFLPDRIILGPEAKQKVTLRVTNPEESNMKGSVVYYAAPGLDIVDPGSEIAVPPKSSKDVSFEVLRLPNTPEGNYFLSIEIDFGKRLGRLKKAVDVVATADLSLELNPIGVSGHDGIIFRAVVKNNRAVGAEPHLMIVSELPGVKSDFDKLVALQAGEERTFDVVLKGDWNAVSWKDGISLVAREGSEDRAKVTCALKFQPCIAISSRPEFRGDLKQWPTLTLINLASQLYYSPNPDVRDNEWKGALDLGVRVWTAWDEDFLYLAADVSDDCHSQEHSGQNLFQGDSVQFALDIFNNKALTHDNGCFEFLLGLGHDGPQLYKLSGPLTPPGIVNDAVVDIAPRQGGMVYEVKIPWKSLGMTPHEGGRIGFSLLVNDDDGKGRKGWMEWTSGIGSGKSPRLFGDLIFVTPKKEANNE